MINLHCVQGILATPVCAVSIFDYLTVLARGVVVG